MPCHGCMCIVLPTWPPYFCLHSPRAEINDKHRDCWNRELAIADGNAVDIDTVDTLADDRKLGATLHKFTVRQLSTLRTLVMSAIQKPISSTLTS